MLKERVPVDAMRLLGIVDRDIFIPMLTFVFGQAQLNGEVALVSLTRLRQESYGLPPDAGLFLDRACTEAVHELGHTFGLVHCRDVACAMSLSTSIEHVDAKAASLCPSCGRLLRDSIGSLDLGGRHPGKVEEDRR
jgi:archaemetzincin